VEARERILQAAARLLSEAGGEPVSTRAICAEAGVTAPTLYHHFGDKDGLFDAVVAHGFEEYLAKKRATEPTGDPVRDLAEGWDAHVEFGRTHPSFYLLMYGAPRQGRQPTAAKEAHQFLLGMLENVARSGRLLADVEPAARMIEAASTGVTLQLITDPGQPDPLAVSERVRDAVLDTLVRRRRRSSPSTMSALATQLASLLGQENTELSEAELALLREWLTRLSTRP
jgi:AcrR family transcriptional regulator